MENSNDFSHRTIKSNSLLNKTALKYKSVIAEIMKLSYKTEQECIVTGKLRKYAFSLADRLLCGEQEFGDTHYCVLARINENGYEYLNSELLSKCKEVIAIEDEWGAVADEILVFLKNEAVSRKIDVICCYNPFLQYSLERIILPHKKCAVCRDSGLCRVPTKDKTVHSARFCSKDELNKHKEMLKFNNKIIAELLVNCHRFDNCG